MSDFNFLGLCSGVGGFEISADAMGWQVVSYTEMDRFCNHVLKYYFPHAKAHEDIKTADYTIYRGLVDIICGGVPCQPFSKSGKMLGTADPRHLWPSMLRAIREICPAYVVFENVHGFLSWSGGLVFNQVQTDLESEGYEVTSFVLPAAGVGAPHERYRVFIVAFKRDRGNNRGKDGTLSEDRASTNTGNGHQSGGFGENRCQEGESTGKQDKRQRVRANTGGISEQEPIANTEGVTERGQADKIKSKPVGRGQRLGCYQYQ